MVQEMEQETLTEMEKLQIQTSVAIQFQNEEIRMGLLIRDVMDMIHEYKLDDLHTSLMNVNNDFVNENYDDVNLGDFRWVLKNRPDESKIRRLNNVIVHEKEVGRSNKPMEDYGIDPKTGERTWDFTIFYKHDAVIEETESRIESMLDSVLDGTNTSVLFSKYDYINNRYVSVVKKEIENLDERVEFPPGPVRIISEVDDDGNIFVYDSNLSKIAVKEENKDAIENIVDEVVDSHIQREIRKYVNSFPPKKIERG